jgi:hypothetical protein
MLASFLSSVIHWLSAHPHIGAGTVEDRETDMKLEDREQTSALGGFDQRRADLQTVVSGYNRLDTA